MNTNNKVDYTKALIDTRNYAKKFLKEEFNLELEIPIELNGRLKRSMGRFESSIRTKKPLKMDFSKDLFKYYDLEDITGVIKHECVHYALCTTGKPFHDGDDYFEKTLKRVNAPSTKVIEVKSPMHHYECDKCGRPFATLNKKDYSGYHCNKCGDCSKIIYRGLHFLN